VELNLTPVILATWEAEIRRIMVQSQPVQIVLQPLTQNYPTQSEVAQVVVNLPSKCKGTEIKPHYYQKKKKKRWGLMKGF
jgi:hypothetical protein